MVKVDKYEIDEVGGVPIYPWGAVDPDPKLITGGDMYQILLSASLGFKSIHGANTSPTCEVLSIVHRPEGEMEGCGLIKWNPKPAPVYPTRLGNDISDVFYGGKSYKGSVTKVGSVMAYESGLWEPSMRKRAKATAFLAAAIHAHGKDRGEAARIVSLIAGDEIDVEAVESALLPASHLKREMAMVSKANHRVFSKGTIQCGITWDDSHLGFRDRRPTMAFDWGRVTALARSIAEANIQNCEAFRLLAASSGVPYTIVKNAWAYVSSLDYYLSLESMKKVRIIKASDYGIPSLTGTFVGHEADILLALNRTLTDGEGVVEGDTFKVYQDMYRKAKERLINRRGRQVHTAHSAQEVTISAHLVTAENVVALSRVSQLVHESFLRSIAYRRVYDKRLKSAIEMYTKPAKGTDKHQKGRLLDGISRLMFSRATWVMAQAIISDELREMHGDNTDDLDADLNNAIMQLNVTKQTLAGYPSHIVSEITFTNSILERLKRYTEEYLGLTEGIDPDVNATQRSMVEVPLRQTITAMGQLTTHGVDLLERVRDECSGVYRKWFDEANQYGPAEFRDAATKWLYTSYALNGLEIGDCLTRESGYIDGTRPRSSYVFQATSALSRLFNLPSPKLKRLIYQDALKIAGELDESTNYPFSVSFAVEYTTSVLDKIIGAMMHGDICKPEKREFDDTYAIYAPNDSPPYAGGVMEHAEFEAMFEAMMEDAHAELEKTARVTYDSCLDSYPTKELAEKYAEANGYGSFREAFEILGDEVGYVEGSKYVEDARGNIARMRIEQGEESPAKKFRSLI